MYTHTRVSCPHSRPRLSRPLNDATFSLHLNPQLVNKAATAASVGTTGVGRTNLKGLGGMAVPLPPLPPHPPSILRRSFAFEWRRGGVTRELGVGWKGRGGRGGKGKSGRGQVIFDHKVHSMKNKKNTKTPSPMLRQHALYMYTYLFACVYGVLRCVCVCVCAFVCLVFAYALECLFFGCHRH